MSDRKRGHRRRLTQVECDRVKTLCGMYPQETVCRLADISQATLWAVRKRGFTIAKRQLRPVPSTFALVAEGKSAEWLRREFNTTNRVIARWRAEMSIAPAQEGHPALPTPIDFRAVYTSTRTVKAVAEHYGVDQSVIRRWRKGLGIPGKKEKPAKIGLDHIAEYYRRAAA